MHEAVYTLCHLSHWHHGTSINANQNIEVLQKQLGCAVTDSLSSHVKYVLM